jgi:hypothetical protein
MMNDQPTSKPVEYHVTVVQKDVSHAVALARNHTLTLNIMKRDGAMVFA